MKQKFYLSGGSAKRYEKVKAISENPDLRDHLSVCKYGLGVPNCGRCEKCVRTIVEMYATGCLDRFGAAFDLGDIRERMPEILERVAVLQIKNEFCRDVMSILRERMPSLPEAEQHTLRRSLALYEVLRKQRNHSEIS